MQVGGIFEANAAAVRVPSGIDLLPRHWTPNLEMEINRFRSHSEVKILIRTPQNQRILPATIYNFHCYTNYIICSASPLLIRVVETESHSSSIVLTPFQAACVSTIISTSTSPDHRNQTGQRPWPITRSAMTLSSTWARKEAMILHRDHL